MSLSPEDVSAIKGMLKRGDRQSDIAAFFGVNSGRVSEINTGQMGADVAPAVELPPPGPYVVSGRAAMKSKQTLEALRDLINETLKEIAEWETSND